MPFLLCSSARHHGCLPPSSDSPFPLSLHSPHVLPQQLSKAIHTDLKTKREDVKKTSFWVPVCTPEAKDTGIDKVRRKEEGYR